MRKSLFVLPFILMLATGCNQAVKQQSTTSKTGTVKIKKAAPAPIDQHIGYIKTVYSKNGTNYLSINYVQWLDATPDKTCSVDTNTTNMPQCNPNGYLIVKQNSNVVTLAISKNASITMQTYDSGKCASKPNEVINFSTFEKLWTKTTICQSVQNAPFNIKVQNGNVINITEQYIP